MRQLERFIVLNAIDSRWREHLDDMDYLREGIHLRGMAQKDPLVEYRVEGHTMFQEMMAGVKEEVVSLLFHAEIVAEPTGLRSRRPPAAAGWPTSTPRRRRSTGLPRPPRPRRDLHRGALGRVLDADRGRCSSTAPRRRSGRNDPCPCGSGHKYKRCHGKAA